MRLTIASLWASIPFRLTPHPPAGRSRYCLRLAGSPSAGVGPARVPMKCIGIAGHSLRLGEGGGSRMRGRGITVLIVSVPCPRQKAQRPRPQPELLPGPE